jgi:thioredoxin 1
MPFDVASVDEWKTYASTTPCTVIKFSADWCGPCKLFKPIYESLSDEIAVKYGDGNVKFLCCDADECRDLVDYFNVNSLPTVIIFKGQQRLETLAGIPRDGQLEGVIRTALGF